MRSIRPRKVLERGRFIACRCRNAFTLIEFILVMALLAVVVAIAAPALSNFFRGRKLESEATRFVALTRYGQSQAVSEGFPMIMWVDLMEGTYGLREQDAYSLKDLPLESERLRQREGYEAVDAKRPEFRLAENLHFEMESSGRTNSRIVTIRFLPDGAIDEGSLRTLLILQDDRRSTRQKSRDAEQESVWIAQSRDRSRYEIVDKSNVWERINMPSEIPNGLYIR